MPEPVELKPQPAAPADTPPDPTALMRALVDSDQTRKLVVKLVFGQFIISVAGIGLAMVFKGWDISNTALTILTMVIQAEISAMTTAVGFYLGSSQGSAMKTMTAALAGKT